MYKIMLISICAIVTISLLGCSQNSDAEAEIQGAAPGAGQSGVADNTSTQDVVKVAVNSPDHKTLVAAVKAAELVDVLSNVGPFTVFAPTDAAFAKVPKDALEDLMKPENKEALANVLYHHVQVSKYSLDRIRSSATMQMFDGKSEEVKVDGEDVYIGGAKILGSVDASNGIVYVVDKVILPK